MSYSDSFKDPRWQKKRLEILNRDNFICQHCFENKNMLHVHHRFYRGNKKPWEYENHVLITLCDDCHIYQHEEEPYKYLLSSLFKMGVTQHNNEFESYFYMEKNREPSKDDLIDIFIKILNANKNKNG